MKKAADAKALPKGGLKVRIQFAEKPTDEEMPMEEGDPAEEAAEPKEFEKFELEQAVRTLHEAEEIKQNASLMKAIGPMLDKKSKAIKSLDDLRALAKSKLGSNRIEG